MPPQEPQITDEDRERAELSRRMRLARAKRDAQEQAGAEAPKGSFHERALQMGMQVVKPIPSRNGYVYKDQSGKLFYADAGGSINNQEEIQRILGGETPKTTVGAIEYGTGAAGTLPPERRAAVQKQMIAQDPMLAGVLSGVQAIPFGGTSVDELVGGVLGSEKATTAAREMQSAMREQEPGYDVAAQLAMGGGLAALTAPLVPLQAAARAAQASPLGLAIAGLGAGMGEGFVSGLGAGEGNLQERMPSGVTGGVIGGALGGTLGLLARPFEAGVKNIFLAFRNKPLDEMAKTLGISKPAAAEIMASIDAGDIPTARASLQRSGSTSMLADATQGTKNLLDFAMAAGGGGEKTRQALLARNLRGEQELRGAFNRFLGQPQDIVDATGAIRQASSTARQQMYDAAYSAPLNYSTLAGRQLENWQRLIPAEALNYANKIRSMDPGARAPQIKFVQNPDGTISFEELPNVEQWDLITRGLNEMAYGSPAGVMGGKSEVQSLAAKNAREIRKLVMDQVPEYRAALGLARDTIEEVQAAEIGFNLLNPSTTVKEIQDMLSGQTPAVRESMKTGLRSGLDYTLGNMRVSAANPNTALGELQAGLSILRSRNNTSKIRELLGDADADEFYKVLDEQATGIELTAAVATNSKTYQRQAGEQRIKERIETPVLGAILRGKPINASQQIFQSITGRTPEADAMRRMGIYDDIATVLTQLRGQSATDALNLIERAKAGRALNDTQARIIANAVTTPAAYAAYKTLTNKITNAITQPTRPYQAGMGRPE